MPTETAASVAVEEPVAPPTTTATDPAKPTDDAEQPAPPAEQTEQAPEESEQEQPEPDIEEAPEDSGKIAKFKPAYKEFPELRTIVGREAGFTEIFPKFSEARQFREWFPTIEDAEATVKAAEALRASEQTYRSDPEAYLEHLDKTDQRAFSSLAAKIPDYLARTDPRTYTELSRSVAENIFANLLDRTPASDEQNMLALQMVAQRLGVTLGQSGLKSSRPDPREAEIERLKQREKDREAADRTRSHESFVASVASGVEQACRTEIERGVRKALPNATDGKINYIVNRTWTEVLSGLDKQTQTKARVNSVYDQSRAGKADQSAARSLVSFVTAQAQPLIKGIRSKIISEETQDQVSRNNNQIAKQKGIADKSKDVGTGVQAGGGAARSPAKPGPRTEADIYEALRSGTYQPRA